MKIDYQLNANDMADFQVYWWRKKSKLKPWMLIVLLVVFVSFLQVHLLPAHPLMFFYFAGIPFAVIFAFAVWFVPFAAKLRAKSVPGFLDQRHLCVEPTGLIEKTSMSETKLNWKQIQAIEEGPTGLYFFINAQYAFLLPKRMFNSPAEVQTFLNESRRYWEAAKTGQPALADDAVTWPPPPQRMK